MIVVWASLVRSPKDDFFLVRYLNDDMFSLEKKTTFDVKARKIEEESD